MLGLGIAVGAGLGLAVLWRCEPPAREAPSDSDNALARGPGTGDVTVDMRLANYVESLPWGRDSSSPTTSPTTTPRRRHRLTRRPA